MLLSFVLTAFTAKVGVATGFPAHTGESQSSFINPIDWISL